MLLSVYRLLTRWWTAFAVLASLGLLGAAHAFERYGGLAPCNLCLKQREVLGAALAIAVPATVWAIFSRSSRGTPRIASFLLFGVFVAGAVTALFHAGGEAGWWALPPGCTGGAVAGLDALRALAEGTGSTAPIPSCGDVTWRFAGLSMAGWNTMLSVALAAISLVSAMRPKDARAPQKPEFGKS